MATNEFTATKVITGKVRFSYLNVFKPVEDKSGKLKYSVALLIPKTDTKTLAAIKKAQDAAAEAGKAKGIKLPPTPKTTLHDGDGVKPNSGEEYGEECKGHFVLNTSSTTRPGLVDKQLNPIMDQEQLYSGCYGRASISFFAYDVEGGKGVSCGLNNLMKLEDGDSLGGRSSAESDFAEFAEEDDML